MIIFTSELLGCAYSIDDEGCLFYTPKYMDDTINVMDWCEVDFMSLLGEEEEVQQEIHEIWNQLIKANQAIGCYYTTQAA